MNIKQAMSILCIDSVEDERSLKKQYRARMKDVHPDSGGDGRLSAMVVEAYNYLMEATRNSRNNSDAYIKFKESTGYKTEENDKSINISIEALSKLFEGKSLYDKAGVEILNTGNIKNKRVIVNADIVIYCYGSKYELYDLCIYQYHNSMTDKENLYYRVVLNDLPSGEVGMKVVINGKELDIKTANNNIRLKLNYDSYKVELIIERRQA